MEKEGEGRLMQTGERGRSEKSEGIREKENKR
jgi:hypothetical protein